MAHTKWVVLMAGAIFSGMLMTACAGADGLDAAPGLPSSDAAFQDDGPADTARLPAAIIGEWTIPDGQASVALRESGNDYVKFDGKKYWVYYRTSDGDGWCKQDYRISDVSDDGLRGSMELTGTPEIPFEIERSSSITEDFADSCGPKPGVPVQVSIDNDVLTIEVNGNATEFTRR